MRYRKIGAVVTNNPVKLGYKGVGRVCSDYTNIQIHDHNINDITSFSYLIFNNPKPESMLQCLCLFVCGQMLAKHRAAGLGDGTRRLRLFGRTRVNNDAELIFVKF